MNMVVRARKVFISFVTGKVWGGNTALNRDYKSLDDFFLDCDYYVTPPKKLASFLLRIFT